MPGLESANLLVGHSTNDDAAVYRIEGDRVLVQTVDFFTPIVDDPELFGAIAAANSVSDVYAMGAEPILALAVAMFPTNVLPLETLHAIFRGGASKAAEAGFPIAGGHTIIDDVPKYGLCVTGTATVDSFVRNSTAKVGDALYLTKPIGNGLLVAAHRRANGTLGKVVGRQAPSLDEAIDWMLRLNRDAARAMVAAGASAATDVTGYGLIGHLLEMCTGSGVGALLDASAVPLLEHARALAEQGIVPGGSKRNAETFRRSVESKVDEVTYQLLCDAQTSGGLLIAIAADRGDAFERECVARGVSWWRIGEVTPRNGTIELR